MISADLDEMVFLDLELEIEPHCESEWHERGIYGHKKAPLVYVEFHCRCQSRGVQTRCITWVEVAMNRDHWTCGYCDMQIETKDWFRVIGPVT